MAQTSPPRRDGRKEKDGGTRRTMCAEGWEEISIEASARKRQGRPGPRLTIDDEPLGSPGPRALAVGGVLEALLFDFRRILPDDVARPRIDQLEAVEDVVARALRRAGREALQLAGEEEVGALELHHVRVGAGGDLAAL